jgi:hypothetical protein
VGRGIHSVRWRLVGSNFRLGFRAMASSASLALDQNHFLAHWGQAPGDLGQTGDRPPAVPGGLGHTGGRHRAIWRTRGTGTGRFGAILGAEGLEA